MKNKTFSIQVKPLPVKPDVHLFFVLENDVSAISLDIDFDPDIYYVEDERLDDRELWKNPEAFFSMFLDDISEAGTLGKRIVVAHYNPMVAQCVRAFFTYFEREKRIQWHALSFFHDDEGTKWLGLSWTDVLLEKVYELDSMSRYPWIQKLEVEPDKSINHRTLLQMVLDEEEFARLDNEDEEPYARVGNDEPPQLTWEIGDIWQQDVPDAYKRKA
jgi:hypothetical protein